MRVASAGDGLFRTYFAPGRHLLRHHGEKPGRLAAQTDRLRGCNSQALTRPGAVRNAGRDESGSQRQIVSERRRSRAVVKGMKSDPRRLELASYPYRLEMATRLSDIDQQW